MARIRTIKPEFWTHEGLSALPEATHMLAAALLNYADDDGYFNANPGLVQAATSPLREPSVSIPDSLHLLAKEGYLRLGTGPDGRRYGHIVSFTDHQTISHAKPSKIKDVGIVWDEVGSIPVTVQEQSILNREQGTGNRTGNREQGTREARDFDEWYAIYPRHVARGAALKAYKAVRKRDVDAETLLAGAQRAALQYAGTDPQFIPMPATWLNAERWLDEEGSKPNGKHDRAAQRQAEFEREQAEWRTDITALVAEHVADERQGSGGGERH